MREGERKKGRWRVSERESKEEDVRVREETRGVERKMSRREKLRGKRE